MRARDFVINLHTDFPIATKQPFDRHGAGSSVVIMLLPAISYPGAMCISEPNNFMDNISWSRWINYPRHSWFETVDPQRRLACPYKFFLANNWEGSIFEVITAFFMMPAVVTKKYLGELCACSDIGAIGIHCQFFVFLYWRILQPVLLISLVFGGF